MLLAVAHESRLVFPCLSEGAVCFMESNEAWVGITGRRWPFSLIFVDLGGKTPLVHGILRLPTPYSLLAGLALTLRQGGRRVRVDKLE